MQADDPVGPGIRIGRLDRSIVRGFPNSVGPGRFPSSLERHFRGAKGRIRRSDGMDKRTRQRRRRGRAREPAAPATRSADYRHLVSPLALARGYSDDQIAQIHATALTVLQELGVRVNHDGARDLLARAGAAVTGHQVRFGCEMVEAAIASSPPEFTLSGGNGTLRIGGPGADPDHAARSAGRLRRLHVECRHEIRSPRLRHARVRACALGHGPARAAGRNRRAEGVACSGARSHSSSNGCRRA